MRIKRVVVAIYIDPDFYPPTINSILNLSEVSAEVIVISRHNSDADYPYPSNVHLKKIGKFCTVRNMEKQSVLQKVKYFLQFTVCLLRYSISKRTDLILLYDPLSLLSYYLIKGSLSRKKIWYHNHDMPDKGAMSKFSIGGLAAAKEKRAMKHIDFFSLPTEERLQYYQDVNKSLPIYIIPNYPSLKVYKEIKPPSCNSKILRIIFQGFIGAGRSLEELIELLKENINGYSLQLILKGSVTEEYKSLLDNLAKKHAVSDKFFWLPIGPYNELPLITASCDIGIGINMNTDNISQAMGTASNKIYEYAACFLPVILYDSFQFRKYLNEYSWAFFSNGTLGSLKENIAAIAKNRMELGYDGRKNFEEKLNFENNFSPVLGKIITTKKYKQGR